MAPAGFLFERFCSGASLSTVHWFKTLGLLTLLALWLPATNHCRLEQLPGLRFLACCDHEDATASHHDDCRTDDCAAVESGLYKTVSGRIQAPVPVLLTTSLLTVFLEEIPAPPACCLTGSPVVSPPDSGGWQFSFRTALPPRAPSFAS
jgi:hypothetical protein